jgi:formate hydrogenlyase subunit 4
MADRILFNLLQIVVMAFSPLTAGVLSRLKEIVQSKRGPRILQPYRDLWKLFHEDEVAQQESSWIVAYVLIALVGVKLLS